MEYNITTLENVKKIPIGNITGKENWDYNYKIDVVDFNLTINGENYPFTHTVPKNETYPLATGIVNLLPPFWRQGWGKMDYNHSFTNLKILPRDLTKLIDFTISYKNVSCDGATNVADFMGNATYIPINESLPQDQGGRVFLLEEETGVENQLDNISSNASAVLLIHNCSRQEQYYADTTNYTNLSIARGNNTNSNLTDVIELLQNDTLMIADNCIHGNETFTFSYNFNYSNWAWGEEDFFYVSPHPGYGYGPLRAKSHIIQVRNHREFWGPFASGVLCHGIIGYDNYYDDTHLMWLPLRHWKGWNNSGIPINEWKEYIKIDPALQMFFVNKSVGQCLENISDDPDASVSGYFEQADNWVDAYNVIGNITIDHSPNDNITVISNRYDGWWGECPGDSGAGGGIVLGIAKYFHDHSIKPKYNLTFLMTTGEEWGYRGAWHYSHSHPEDEYNITRWIGTDQLGFNQAGSYLNPVLSDNVTTGAIIEAIAEDTNYENRTDYGYLREEGGGDLDAYAFQGREEECDTICIHKDAKPFWAEHHRAGMDFQEGDSMENQDRSDSNVTFEFAWNVTKYFTVNPDCWLTNVSFEPFDSPKDGDTLNDSIRANYTINTVLPHDLARVEVWVISPGEGGSIVDTLDYTVTSSGLDESCVFTIPDDDVKGNYSLDLMLYNSTGRINKIVGIGDNYNDTSSQPYMFQLYHPFGYINKGGLYKSVEDNITGSNFTANQNGYADNITAYINKEYMSPSYKCMLWADEKLVGTTTENWTSRDEPISSDPGWAVFSFSEPPPLVKGTQYVISCWGNNSYSRLYYDNFTCSRGRYNDSYYGIPPDQVNFTNESRLYSIYCGYTPSPEITDVSATPNTVGFGFNVTIRAKFDDPGGLIDMVKVNISYPNTATGNFTMNHTGNNTYEYVFGDTWLARQYDYTIWAMDKYNGSYSSSNHSFNVSAQASISVCTIKDEYGDNELINLTDPPGNQNIGYELLDDGDVLHVWNKHNSYYFNTSSGIQLTNHYDEYWSHNVLMLGYYDNDEWNLIYRTDELSGFSKDIDTDNENYVNATLWKDLTYQGYDFRLAIRYHLGLNDSDLTVIPYIKNLGQAIPYVLGFGWEIKDIKIADTYENDWIRLYNGTDWINYSLSQTLDEQYTDMDYNTTFYLEGRNEGKYFRRTLYLRWNHTLDYLIRVKSREGEYNAPVTLFIKVGTLGTDQEKYTMMHWLDSDDWLGVNGHNCHSYCGYDYPNDPYGALEGDGIWLHMCTEDHWLVIDLNRTYNIKKIRGRSNMYNDPTSVDIYISDTPDDWGSAVETGISTWQDTTSWAEVDITDTVGRYINISITSTEGMAGEDYLEFGGTTPMTIFDVYGEAVSNVTYYFDSYDNRTDWATNPGCMVDGNISTYASTYINGDVERCDGNTCPGDDLGNISRVELRVYGYYTSIQRDIILQPLFDGTPGSEYTYQATSTANWSEWFDITDDNSAPSNWQWTDVDCLDCDVKAGSGEFEFTLYCSKVEIRVSYNPAPEISDPYPADGSIGVSISPVLDITVSDAAGDTMDITWLSNSSGSWQVFGTNNSVGNGTHHQTFSNASVNGQWWYWKVNVTDGTNYNETIYKFYTGYQSKIKNTGTHSIKGYLLIQVQFYNETSQNWVVADDTVNETSPRTINWDGLMGEPGENILALDTIFNGLVNTSNLSDYGNGTYRIYAAFRDPDGNVLVCDDDDETQLVATYEFTITFG